MTGDSTRFLLFKDYGAGYSNQLMCVELAVGLAHATGRSLVLYGNWNSQGGLRSIMGGHSWHVPEAHAGVVDNSRVPTILDLLENLPVARVDYRVFLEFTRSRALSRVDCPLALLDAFFVDALGPHEDVESFSCGRFALTDPPEDVFHLYRANLGYYSRFFYNPSPELSARIAGVHLRQPYLELAHAAARTIKPFNALHVRLADFRNAMDVGKLFPDDRSYGRVIADALCAHFSPDELLVISTDEPGAEGVFAPVRERFRRTVMVDELLTGPFATQFRSLPFHDEVTFASVCQAILCEANDFIGTPRSTFSGMIHRAVHSRPALFGKPFKFTFSGFADGTAAFDRGIYLEAGEGPYSWNRLRIPASEGQKAWVREWPEAIVPRRVSVDPSSPSTDHTGKMINVALGRHARQSSLSQWSHAYDADRAVSGWRNAPFVFHTDFEATPWWEVDLGRIYPIDRVVVYNRRDGCRERARTLSISVRSDTKEAGTSVYSRADSFVDTPAGVPLVVELRGRCARFVRIQLHEHTALHLQQVEIFLQPADYARAVATV